MSTKVSIDCESGTLRRYEVGGEKIRLTHCAEPKPGIFPTAAQIENFRIWPNDVFSVKPPPRPTNPPAAAGQCRIQIAA